MRLYSGVIIGTYANIVAICPLKNSPYDAIRTVSTHPELCFFGDNVLKLAHQGRPTTDTFEGAPSLPNEVVKSMCKSKSFTEWCMRDAEDWMLDSWLGYMHDSDLQERPYILVYMMDSSDASIYLPGI